METGFIVSIIGGCLIIILCIVIVLLIKYGKEEKIEDIKVKVSGGKEITEKHSNEDNLIMDFVSIEDEVEHTVCFGNESSNHRSEGNAVVPQEAEEDNSTIDMNAFSEKRIRLTDIKNNRVFEVQIRDEVIIGRLNEEGELNFVQIDYDRSISRRHCKIERKENGYYLSDLGSVNHVFVNNSVLKGTVEMFSGQVFALGKVELMFEVL